ncbi:MAG: hypothetical protein KBG42_04565 [Lachnospiraceae bacterium]|nr:hypothetical protein [Lachnospiraceae bacterium]
MSKPTHKLIFFTLIIILSLRLIYLFTCRTSYFCDEVYTYGISNSLGNPVLVWNDAAEISTDEYNSYRGEWYDGSTLHNYLTIESEERFHFYDVILNKSWDNAPPNYELLVHFVCSFFPESFSWAYAFIVNFIFYAASLILVFFISKDTLKNQSSKYFNAISCMVFFGLSICGTGAFTFLRMYGVLCFYSLLMIFAIQRIINNINNKIFDYALLSISFFGGIFTHTLFIIFAFWITLFTCIYLLTKKQIKKSLISGSTVLLSLITFLLIYRFNFSKIDSWMGNQNSDGYSFATKLSVANSYTFTQSIGFYIPFSYANILTWLGIVIFVAIILTLMCFLFRKEKWFKSIKDKTVYRLKNISNYISKSTKEISPLVLIMFFSSIGYLLVISAISPIVTQGIYSVRYLLLCMNPMIICFISFIDSFFINVHSRKRIIGNSLIILFLSCLLIIQNHVYQNPLIFSNHDDHMKLHDLVSDKDVAVFTSRNALLNLMIIPLRDSDHFYFEKISSDIEYDFTVPDKDFYIVIDESVFNTSGESTVTYYNYIPGINNSSEFISYIMKDNTEDYSITEIDEYIINRGLYSVYHLEPKQK